MVLMFEMECNFLFLMRKMIKTGLGTDCKLMRHLLANFFIAGLNTPRMINGMIMKSIF